VKKFGHMSRGGYAKKRVINTYVIVRIEKDIIGEVIRRLTRIWQVDQLACRCRSIRGSIRVVDDRA